MERLSCDEVEYRINLHLEEIGNQPLLPVVDHDGREVGLTFKDVDFLGIFNPDDHPDIYNGLRDRIILHIASTHVRIVESVGEALSFVRGLKGPIRIIQGP